MPSAAPIPAAAPATTQPAPARPTPPRRRSRTGWWILLILVGLGGLLVLAGLFFYGVFQGMLPGGHSSRADHAARLHEVVKEEGNSSERILVIRVEGVIGGDPIDGLGLSIVELLQDQLDRGRRGRHRQGGHPQGRLAGGRGARIG